MNGQLTFTQRIVYCFGMPNKVRNPIVEEIVRVLRGFNRAAEAIGISEQALARWHMRGVPPKRCIQVEKLTGIPRERLRPDVFGAPRPRPRRSAAKLNQAAA